MLDAIFAKEDNEYIVTCLIMQNSERDFEFNGFESPLRQSLFDGLPPYINYVPSNGISNITKKPPQYWNVNKVSI